MKLILQTLDKISRKMAGPIPATRFPGISITRQDFPKDFIFGSATSAYQVEGAYDSHGKSMSMWDTHTLRRPDKVAKGSNGCVAIDHYHRYKEDILLIKNLGLDAYRFSICWPRILPGGRLSSGVNRAGIQHYSDVIDFCLSQGIEPFVTIFHFDLPQCLEDEYGGFLSSNIVEDFGELANLCFLEFGNRVKYWITLNEPWTFTVNGYVLAEFPPLRGASPPTLRSGFSSSVVPYRTTRRFRSPSIRAQVRTEGDAGTEPYIVAHNLHLCHAKAVDIYRNFYQAAQGGKIGITNLTTWYEPLNPDDPEDVAAARRAVDFSWGWFMAPIVHGDYPAVMRQLVGKRLPKFTPKQVESLQGSYDFIGLNYYTTLYAQNIPFPPNYPFPSYFTDQNVIMTGVKDHVPIGPTPGSDWNYIVPRGIYGLLTHTRDEYNDPLIYIAEQGMSTLDNPRSTVTAALMDEVRYNSYQDHLTYVKQAIDHDGVKIKAFFLWSMFDNFEWAEGYTSRFGIYHIDYKNGLRRYPKLSAIWWMNFLKTSPLNGQAKKSLTISDETPSSNKRLRSG